MQAAHLPPVARGNSTQYHFPDKPAAPDDIHITSGDYPLPVFPEDANGTICYIVRVATTAFTRGELTWLETLKPDNFHSYGGPILGHDVAGTVESIHHEPSQVPKFKPGDEVWGLLDFDRNGAAADFALALENELSLAPKCPKDTSKAEWNRKLATVPLSGLTALQALFTHANVPISALHSSESIDQAKRVLVTGAAGCVGALVIQLAKAAGLNVTALCSKNSKAFVESELKPDSIIDYTAAGFLSVSTEMVKQQIAPVDIVIDCRGGDTLKDLLLLEGSVIPGGKIVSIVGPLSIFGVETMQRLEQSCIFRKLDFVFFIVKPHAKQLHMLGLLLCEERLKTFVDAVYPLEEARIAMHRVQEKTTKRGKVVVEIRRK